MWSLLGSFALAIATAYFVPRQKGATYAQLAQPDSARGDQEMTLDIAPDITKRQLVDALEAAQVHYANAQADLYRATALKRSHLDNWWAVLHVDGPNDDFLNSLIVAENKALDIVLAARDGLRKAKAELEAFTNEPLNPEHHLNPALLGA